MNIIINAPCTSAWQGEAAELDYAIVTRIADLHAIICFIAWYATSMYVHRIAPCTVMYMYILAMIGVYIHTCAWWGQGQILMLAGWSSCK